MITEQILILGASSGIAKAIAKQTLQNRHIQVTVISRNTTFYELMANDYNNLNIINIADYSPEKINDVVTTLSNKSNAPITHAYLCHGILHNDNIQPEKKLEDIKVHSFEEVMKANALTPMLWVQKLTPLLHSKTICKLVVLSARVGSISDNHLGGWYSYRASKAALNMMLKNAAIEFSRRAKNIKIIAFHPGTTDTALSKPFQKNVPKGKLFTTDFVARQLIAITDATNVDGQLSYLDWQGEKITW